MIKKFTLGLGITFLVIGVAGMITGGHNHNLVIFGINTTHNTVHLLSGILAVVTALMSVKAAKMYCLIFGSVYGIVTIAGFLNIAPIVSMLNLNMPDNLLHLVITVGCLYFGLTTKQVYA